MMKMDKRLILAVIACLGLTHCGQPEVKTTPKPGESEGENTTGTIQKLDFRTILVGRAMLPARSLQEGPRSGKYLGQHVINDQPTPFSGQPVQGISAVLYDDDGSLLAMSDNGFGSQENSADYHLRVYKIQPNLKTRLGGSGRAEVTGFIELHDPDKHIPFPITYTFSENRTLTGADFDLESMQRAPDGTLWFGDEFGPYLLHTDAQGKLLEAPIPLPDFDNPGQHLQSPQNPHRPNAALLRVMNAVRQHGEVHNMRYQQTVSPHYKLLKLAKDDAQGVFNLAGLKQGNFSVIPWTVNEKAEMLKLMVAGVDGIITDRPDILMEALREFDANEDGTPGDYLTAEGLVKLGKFKAQGHRGARDLRPENTLPAMEAALDYLMNTMELDIGVSLDGQPVLNHDPHIEPEKCRRADGSNYSNAVLMKTLNVSDIQQQFICDKVFRGDAQSNDLALSPVAKAFAAEKNLSHAYIMPSLAQVFEFVDFYRSYYLSGEGKAHKQASVRASNAQRIRFNIETKINPEKPEQTVDVSTMAEAVASAIKTHDKMIWSDIQSFDLRTLLYIQEKHPDISTVYLFGDELFGKNPNAWLAGFNWPQPADYPARVPASGGFEGMAITPDGKTLLPMLEKPLVEADDKTLRVIYEFNVKKRKYTGKTYLYQMREDAVAIGEFILYDDTQGLIIERDSEQGDEARVKQVFRVQLGEPGEIAQKFSVTNLLDIFDPGLLGWQGWRTGDAGLRMHYFGMPYVTIESVALTPYGQLLVANDNNYPFSVGRHIKTGMTDNTEFVLLELPDSIRDGLGIDFQRPASDNKE